MTRAIFHLRRIRLLQADIELDAGVGSQRLEYKGRVASRF
jgi:hypothetical protein